MMYKHKNVSQGTFSIKDSKGVCYALEPGKELILDKNNEWKGMIEVEEIGKDKSEKKEEEIDFDLNGDGVVDGKDKTIAAKLLRKKINKVK